MTTLTYSPFKAKMRSKMT